MEIARLWAKPNWPVPSFECSMKNFALTFWPLGSNISIRESVKTMEYGITLLHIKRCVFKRRVYGDRAVVFRSCLRCCLCAPLCVGVCAHSWVVVSGSYSLCWVLWGVGSVLKAAAPLSATRGVIHFGIPSLSSFLFLFLSFFLTFYLPNSIGFWLLIKSSNFPNSFFLLFSISLKNTKLSPLTACD